MKSDADLKRDVAAELAWDPAVNANAIGVAVRDGVVTLTGHIETFAEKRAVEKALRRVGGVRAIALELDVRLAPEHRRSDTDIARAAEMALQWNSQVPPDAVRVSVDKGWVTLMGVVEWEVQRQSAEKAIRPLTGVVAITNEIRIHAKATPANVSDRIREALTRQAEREARRVDVQIEDGTATLSGRVHSWQERDAAQGAAWSAPGVRVVVNNIVVDGGD